MVTSHSRSPSAKRVKLEHDSSTPELDDGKPNEEEEGLDEDSENNCSICLQPLVDRTVIPKCSHEFCFDCLLVWTEQSRRCPLCSQTIGDYLIHSIRSRYDYRKHYLTPLRTSPPPSRQVQNNAALRYTRQHARIRRQDRVWGPSGRDRTDDESDKLERSILKRRWIYEHDLYAKHVASNAFTKYRPYPTPSQFSASQDLISRTTTFLRRELQVWEGLDVEFLTTLIISLMKSIDIRSESAVKLISEFLDMDEPYTPGGRHKNAEHFAHEVYSYVRSPYKDLFVYDSVVQYDAPDVPPPRDVPQRRWYHDNNQPSSSGLRHDPGSPPRERGRENRSRSSERSSSWSPSGRRYSPSRRDLEHSVSPSRLTRTAMQMSDRHSNYGDEDDLHQTSLYSSRNRPSTGSPVEDGFTSPRAPINAKGKEKAAATRPLTRPAGLEHAPASSLSVTDELHLDAPARSIPRPSRNRSLLESVKEHLAKNSANRTRDSLPVPNGSRLPRLEVNTNTSDSTPFLLSRLSDPDTPVLFSHPSVTCPLSTAVTTQILSAPARPSPAYRTPPPDTPEGTGGILHHPTLSTDLWDQDLEPVQKIDPSMDSLEARARLLARLNREKKQAQLLQASKPSSSNTVISQPTNFVVQEAISERLKAEENEAKLRSQVQLRARLAMQNRVGAKP